MFFRGDSDVLALVACQGATQGVSIEEILCIGVFLDAREVVLQV